jgi:phosphatidylglycerol:prolipoprotein diacylglycerol transferase
MIKIPFHPMIFEFEYLALSWHGFFSLIGVLAAIYIVIKQSRKVGIDDDLIFNVASWGIIGGILGARLVHIIDNLDYYLENPLYFIYIWKGGIGVWGGIIGGLLGGVAYCKFSKLSSDSIGQLMDFAAPAMLAGQAIGRIGDIVNGEHCSRATDMIFGWWFSNPNSPGQLCIVRSENYSNGNFPPGTDPSTAVHPSAFYELIWDVLGMIILVKFRNKFKPAGSLWFIYLAWYSLGRFAIQWTRLDKTYFWGFQEAHFISIICMVISISFLAMKTRNKNN